MFVRPGIQSFGLRAYWNAWLRSQWCARLKFNLKPSCTFALYKVFECRRRRGLEHATSLQHSEALLFEGLVQSHMYVGSVFALDWLSKPLSSLSSSQCCIFSSVYSCFKITCLGEGLTSRYIAGNSGALQSFRPSYSSFSVTVVADRTDLFEFT